MNGPGTKIGAINPEDMALIVDKGVDVVTNQLWPWVAIAAVVGLAAVVIMALGMRLLYRAIVELGEDHP